MPTNFLVEQAEQRRWILRPKYAGVTWFDDLVKNEFLSAEEQLALQSQKLSAVVQFAAAEVPYYRDVFKRLRVKSRDIRAPGDLHRLPLLAKQTIKDQGETLRPRALPRDEKYAWDTLSSGSTGPKTRVPHTTRSQTMWNFLSHRGRRWFRFDPMGIFAAIRAATTIGPGPDGKLIADGCTFRGPNWPRNGQYFVTGPYIALSKMTALDQIADWLEQQRPDYVQTDTAVLEHLAFEFQNRPALDCLSGLLAVSEPLTPGMRERVENTFGAPIHQAYGMNEIGIAASTCPEGHRYHVHIEHCLIEIVNEDDEPCAPGEYGRLVVTVFSNLAMPFIRYDTGDLVQALDGPCPCGRTLPTFGRVLGRYNHIAPLPPGVYGIIDALRDAMEQLPPELSVNLRKYQIHHSREGDFELLLVLAGSLPADFTTYVERAWRAAVASLPSDLRIVEVDYIKPPPSEKFFHFTSDYFDALVPRTASDEARPIALITP